MNFPNEYKPVQNFDIPFSPYILINNNNKKKEQKMAYYILDELNKSIHAYSHIVPSLCKVSASDNDQKLISFDEKKLKEFILYKHYNGCRYCLREYHTKMIA